jgi:hypothetical protein
MVILQGLLEVGRYNGSIDQGLMEGVMEFFIESWKL